jgi:hypothetical protein
MEQPDGRDARQDGGKEKSRLNALSSHGHRPRFRSPVLKPQTPARGRGLFLMQAGSGLLALAAVRLYKPINATPDQIIFPLFFKYLPSIGSLPAGVMSISSTP